MESVEVRWMEGMSLKKATYELKHIPVVGDKIEMPQKKKRGAPESWVVNQRQLPTDVDRPVVIWIKKTWPL